MSVTTTKQYTPLSPQQMVIRAIKRSLKSGGSLFTLAADTQAGVNAAHDAGVTGTWRFENNSHIIRLGVKFVDAITAIYPVRGQSGKDKRDIEFAMQILRHEAWHGRVTERDLDALAKQCRTRSIPFLLVNLMEDMRLEHLARKAEGRTFNWWKYMNLEVPTNPTHALMKMVLSESYFCTTFVDHKHPKFKTHAKLWREKVEEFANRIKAAPSTWDVVDIAQEWLDYWHAEGWTRKDHTLPKNKLVDGDIGGDRDGSELDMVKPQGSKSQSLQNNSSNSANVPFNPPTRVPIARFACHTGARPIVASEANAIAMEMRTIIARTASHRSARTSTSGSRLHIAGVASRSDRAFRSYGKTGGKPHLVALVDFSGSMAQDWDSHGRMFTAAVLRLLRSGDITGKLFATGGGMLAEIPLSMTDDQLRDVSPHLTGENIRDSLNALQQEVQDASAVLIYTDAELMDGHVDAGEWRRKGVDLVGTVVIPAYKSDSFRKDKTAKMQQHFGSHVTAENGKALARKLAQHLGARLR
jgi:hypothetical protein